LFRKTKIVIDGGSKPQCWREPQAGTVFFRFRGNNIRRPQLEAQSFYSGDYEGRSHGIRTKAPRFLPAGPFSVAAGIFTESGHPNEPGGRTIEGCRSWLVDILL
jgi:hypothetical protein